MKTFLIIYPAHLNQQAVLVINDCQRIGNWMNIWPGATLVQSDFTNMEITSSLAEIMPAKMFLVTQIQSPSVTAGWMPTNVWDFILEAALPTEANGRKSRVLVGDQPATK